MLHTTRWSPDTCGCVLEYEWDDTQPDSERTHTIKNVIKACPAHAKHAEKGEHYSVVLEENNRKNIAIDQVLKTVTSLGEDVQRDGKTVRQFNPGIEVGFAFDADRKLTLDIKGATKAEKEQAHATITARFPNKAAAL